MEDLISKLQKKEAKIGIIGLGYVGLPLVSEFLSKGFDVIGIDKDQSKIDSLNNQQSYIAHIEDKFISKYLSKSFQASTDISMIEKLDVIVMCLPTPLKENFEPEMKYVFDTVDELIPFLQRGQALSLESTTYPGTTSEDILNKLKKTKYKIGEDFFLIYSPEREAPGNKTFKNHQIPKIVSGHTRNCLEVGKKLYDSIVDKVVPVSSTRTAELTKLLENIHRAVNIGLVNEMKIVAEALEVDIYEVIDAAATKPFGFTPYYPGPGIGGHCIPIDPFYLTWKAKQLGVHTKFIELAGEINNKMPTKVVEKGISILKEKSLDIKNAKILLLGLAYKKDVDDMRESPSIKIMNLFEKHGADVSYSDPFIKTFPKTRDYNYDKKSIEITPKKLKAFDLVVIATDHSSFDYQMIRKESLCILDTRGIYRKNSNRKIFKA